MRASTVSERSASDVGLVTVEPRPNSSVATPSINVAREMLAAAEQRIKCEHGRALSGSVAWLLKGFEGRSTGVPGSLPPPGVWDVNVHRELNRTLGTLRGRNARELLGAGDRRIRHDIMMSLDGRGPWMVLRRPGSLTFVPRRLARQRSVRPRRGARPATRRCGPRSSRQRRCRVTRSGGGGGGSPGDGGGGGSDAGDSGGSGGADPDLPGVLGTRSLVRLGGRRAS
jgi:hypothetical protein